MNTPQIITAAIAVVGVVLLVLALLAQRKYAAMRATRTLTVAELAARPPGDGLTCEIKGMAEPGPAGQLKGPLSGRSCVWFHAKVEERWREYHEDSNGRRHQSTHQRTLREDTSPPHFAVRDTTGTVVVNLDGTTVDSPVRSHHHAEPARRGDGLAGMAIEFLSNKRDHEIVYNEAIVPPGHAIYALGKGAPDPRTGAVTMVEPDSGPYIVSTRTEEQLSRKAVQRMRLFYIGGGVLLLGGGIALAVITIIG